MKKLVIVVFLLTAYSISFGEKITLQEAIDRSYKNSYMIKNAYLDLENSELQVKEAYKEALPKISYKGSYDKNQEDIYGKLSRDDSYLNKIELVQPLYRGGLISAGVSGSKDYEERSKYQFLNVRSDLRLSVVEKYTTILELYKVLEVYRASLEEIESQHERSRRRYDLRLASRAELLPFKTKLINIRTKIMEVQNEIKSSKIDLKNDMGMVGDLDIEVLPLENSYDISLINLEKDVEFARENNRDLRIAMLDYEIRKAEEAVAKSNLLPKIDLRLGYTGESGNFKGSVEEWQWNMGVSVEMNIFQFGQNIDVYKRYKNETKKSKNTQEMTKNDVEVLVRRNYINLAKLEGTVREQEAAIESALENYNVEKRRYENGLTSVVDFLQIESILREAELALVQARLDYYLAYEKYMDSIG